MGWGCLLGQRPSLGASLQGLGLGIPPPAQEESFPALLCTEIDVFNFGICDGNLQEAAGALEAEQEHHELAVEARKSISPESFMRPWIF